MPFALFLISKSDVGGIQLKDLSQMWGFTTIECVL